MLRSLAIRDFVIVDALELDFEAGFSALTGETGAGKSILIDALSLALGARAEGNVVRAGQARTEIAVEFDLDRLPAARAWLDANDIADAGGGACLLRRTIDAMGRSKSFVNGTSVTQSQMRDLAEYLIDIHGQHEHQSLLRREARLAMLDAFAENDSLRAEVAGLFRKWRELADMCTARETNQAAIAREFEDLTWQIGQLAALEFDTIDWERTLSEQRRIANAALLIAAAESAVDGIADAEDAALARVDRLIAALSRAAETDATLRPAVDLVESAAVELREAASALRRYLHGMDADPARLAELDRRIADVHETARRFRLDPVGIPEALQSKRDRLAALGGDQSIEALREQERQAGESYFEAAKRLTGTRQRAAKRFAHEVTAAMQELAMEGGRFAVEFIPREPSADGNESCEFQVSAHQGQPMGVLARVASGGELSRLSLAIQMVASAKGGATTLIFDEVDAGVGGRVADVVGRLLRRLSEKQATDGAGSIQVLAVTHLPQVAARAHHQYKVEKTVRHDIVTTTIRPLSTDERIEEIARMLGGAVISAATRRAAEEMLTDDIGAAGMSRP